MEASEWIQIGIDNGWCGPPVCYPHDGLPMSEGEEEESFFGGEDPCIHIIRMYETKDRKEAVEDYHAPSNWRKPL